MCPLLVPSKIVRSIVRSHFNSVDAKEPLLLIINGIGGTGKSYLIDAICDFLGAKCAITASTGKAAFNVKGNLEMI
jgi:pantothenate kinase-related protein Tda10